MGLIFILKTKKLKSENGNLWTENGSGDEEVWVPVTNVELSPRPVNAQQD